MQGSQMCWPEGWPVAIAEPQEGLKEPALPERSPAAMLEKAGLYTGLRPCCASMRLFNKQLTLPGLCNASSLLQQLDHFSQLMLLGLLFMPGSQVCWPEGGPVPTDEPQERLKKPALPQHTQPYSG